MSAGVASASLFNIVAIYALVVVSPGPNFVFISRLALRDERQAAFACMVGVALGATVNAAFTMFGLAALLVVAPAFRVGILLVGGALLLTMGGATLMTSLRRLRRPQQGSVKPEAVSRAATGRLSALQQGFWLNLTNPKGIAFFMGLYAPLIVGASPGTKLMVLGINFLIEVVWYGTVIMALSCTMARRAYDRYGPAIDLLVGVFLAFLGSRILMTGIRAIWVDSAHAGN